MKFAVDRSLDGVKYETADIGESMERVMRYWTVRDKFVGVHPALRRIGVERIEVDKEGLKLSSVLARHHDYCLPSFLNSIK